MKAALCRQAPKTRILGSRSGPRRAPGNNMSNRRPLMEESWDRQAKTLENRTLDHTSSREGIELDFLQNRKLDRKAEHRCADSTTRVARSRNAVAKVDRTSMQNSVSKCENHCKTWVRQNPGCNFVWENENRCAETTTRGRQNKTRVAKVDRASKKI